MKGMDNCIHGSSASISNHFRRSRVKKNDRTPIAAAVTNTNAAAPLFRFLYLSSSLSTESAGSVVPASVDESLIFKIPVYDTTRVLQFYSVAMPLSFSSLFENSSRRLWPKAGFNSALFNSRTFMISKYRRL